MRPLREEGPLPDARLVEGAAEVRELARSWASEKLLGFDTEADSFHSYFSKVCLVQVSTRTADTIIDPLAVGSLAPLGPVLADPTVTCVFHGADYDLRILDRDHGLHVRGLFDTMVAARLLGYTTFGLSSLLERHFDLRIPKAHQRANWSRRPLTRDMLRYAACDTHYLPGLHDILRAELETKGRLEWALEEFAFLEKVRHQPREEDPDAYLRIKGARALDCRGLAVLHEVYEARERIARRQDRAPFRVLGNTTLVALARARPRRPRDLAGIKGLPRNPRANLERELVEAVQRGLDRREDELPRRRRSASGVRSAPLPELLALRRARDRAAADLQLDPGVVAPNALLEAIARAKPAGRTELLDVPGMRRWQADLLGEAFLEATAKSPDEKAP